MVTPPRVLPQLLPAVSTEPLPMAVALATGIENVPTRHLLEDTLFSCSPLILYPDLHGNATFSGSPLTMANMITATGMPGYCLFRLSPSSGLLQRPSFGLLPKGGCASPSSFLPILPKAPMPANTDAVFLFIKEVVLIDERYVSAARNAEHDVRLLRG